MVTKFKTFVADEQVCFTIGVQSFRLDYEPDEETGVKAKQLEWMRSMLEEALQALAEKPLRLRDMVREENDK
jgi:hypothetical protein